MQGLLSLQQQCIDSANPLAHDWQLNHRQKQMLGPIAASLYRGEEVGSGFCQPTRHCAVWTNGKVESFMSPSGYSG